MGRGAQQVTGTFCLGIIILKKIRPVVYVETIPGKRVSLWAQCKSGQAKVSKIGRP